MRLIDADAMMPLFIKKAYGMKDRHVVKLGEEWLLNYSDIKDVIDNAPTVDVEKIKSELNPTVTCWYDFDRGYEKGYEKAKEELEERPTGEWVWEEEWLPSTTEHPAECQYAEWRCNQCHEPPTDNYEWDDPYNKPRLRYCPNCGAIMRVKDELNNELNELGGRE